MEDKAKLKDRFQRLWQTGQLCGGLSANDAAALAMRLSQKPEAEVPTPLLIKGSIGVKLGIERIAGLAAGDLSAADADEAVAVFGDYYALNQSFVLRDGADVGGVSSTNSCLDVELLRRFFDRVQEYDALGRQGDADGDAVMADADTASDGARSAPLLARLFQAYSQVCLDIEKVGNATAEKLAQQRQQLQNAAAGGGSNSSSAQLRERGALFDPLGIGLEGATGELACPRFDMEQLLGLKRRADSGGMSVDESANGSCSTPMAPGCSSDQPFNPLDTPMGLRCLLIFLCFPTLDYDDHYESMGRIFRAFRVLSRHQKEILGRWLAAGVLASARAEQCHTGGSSVPLSPFPFALFERQLQAVQQYISVRFCEVLCADLPHPDEAAPQEWEFFCARTSQMCKAALACGDIFFRANQKLKALLKAWRKQERHRGTAALLSAGLPRPPCLQLKDFVNDALNEQERVLSHDYTYALYWSLIKFEEEEEEQRQRSGAVGFFAPRRSKPKAASTIMEIEDQSCQNAHTFGLVEYSWCLDPSSKCRLLMLNTTDQQRSHTRQEIMNQVMLGQRRVNPYLVLKVRRDDLIPDTLQQLASQSPSSFRKTLKIVFQGEEGIDEGGVRKEFFQLLLAQLYDPNFAMFHYCPNSKTYWFNVSSLESNLNFELFGTLLGIAIYNRVILDIHFPIAVYQKLLSPDPDGRVKFTLEDLMEVSPEMGKSLSELLEFQGDVEATFCRDYVATYESFGANVVVPLCANGEQVPITKDNRHAFVEDYIHWYFNGSIADKFSSFKKGFSRCMQPDTGAASQMNMFLTLLESEELELLICGSQVLDFEAFRKNADYQDGYTVSSQVVGWFWDVVFSWSEEQRKELLAFCTGSARAPPKGLGAPEVRLTVSRSGPDSEQLPSAHTCFNHLLIPEYASREKLEQKLKLAVANNQGFGLI